MRAPGRDGSVAKPITRTHSRFFHEIDGLEGCLTFVAEISRFVRVNECIVLSLREAVLVRLVPGPLFVEAAEPERDFRFLACLSIRREAVARRDLGTDVAPLARWTGLR
jgi:hypothetical protein